MSTTRLTDAWYAFDLTKLGPSVRIDPQHGAAALLPPAFSPTTLSMKQIKAEPVND
jgi:hypothetical protein